MERKTCAVCQSRNETVMRRQLQVGTIKVLCEECTARAHALNGQEKGGEPPSELPDDFDGGDKPSERVEKLRVKVQNMGIQNQNEGEE